MHVKQLTCSHGNLCIKDVISFSSVSQEALFYFNVCLFTALAYIG